MESLMSRVPSRFLLTITGDEEVAVIFLKELWPHIVGEQLARNSEPRALVNRVLEVRVPSPVWVKQLESLRQMMIESINRFWGVTMVETIRLKVDLKG